MFLLRTSSPPPNRRPGASNLPAFTLFEVVLVVLILGIIAAALVPPLGNNLYASRLRTAANVLAADIDFCASECIAQPAAPRAITFDTDANSYTLIDFNAAAPLKYPADGSDYTNDFATGRNATLDGVHIQSILAAGNPLTSLAFDSYGRPLTSDDVVITLSFNSQTLAVQVSAATGEVSITGN